MLSNLKNQFFNQARLSLSFLIIIILFLIFGFVATRGVFTSGNFTRTIYNHPLVVSNASLKATISLGKTENAIKDIMLSNKHQNLYKLLKTIILNENNIYKELDIIEERILGVEGQELEKETRNLFKNWQPVQKKIIHALNSGDKPLAIQIISDNQTKLVEIESKMLELTAYARNKADTFIGQAEKNQTKLEYIVTTLTILGICISIIIAVIAILQVGKSEQRLVDKNRELERALTEIKTLQGIIPICAHCKQIRDDAGIWSKIEEYIDSHSDAKLSHGICPDCLKKFYPEIYEDQAK